MAWSYDPEIGTALDEVRFLIGDTIETDPQLDNGEITYLLGTEANTMMAAVAAARAIAAKYARKADKAVGDLKISANSLSQKYYDLAKELGSRGMLHQVPTAGGIKVDEQRSNEDDTSLRHGAIRVGMHDYTSKPSYANTEGN